MGVQSFENLNKLAAAHKVTNCDILETKQLCMSK